MQSQVGVRHSITQATPVQEVLTPTIEWCDPLSIEPGLPTSVIVLAFSLRSTCLTVPSSPADMNIAAQQSAELACKAGP